MTRAALLAAGLALIPVAAAAQSLSVGDRVRVLAPPAQPVEGRLARLRRDTLTVATSDGERLIWLGTVRQIETWHGGFGGLVVGALIGGGLAAAVRPLSESPNGVSAADIGIGLLPGAALGFWVAGHGWRRVSLETLPEIP